MKIGKIVKNGLYYAVGMVGALFVALMLRLFVVDFFVVPSDSMLPAIEPGDFILVDKLSFGARMCCNFDFLEKKIEQYQNDLEASKAEYDKPFAYSAELEEKLARQYELNAQLDLENAKAMDADLGGPDEEKSEDRIENAGIVAEDKGIYMPDRNRKR